MIECIYCGQLVDESPTAYKLHMIKNHEESEAHKVWYFTNSTHKERVVNRVERRLRQGGYLI